MLGRQHQRFIYIDSATSIRTKYAFGQMSRAHRGIINYKGLIDEGEGGAVCSHLRGCCDVLLSKISIIVSEGVLSTRFKART